MDDDIFNLIAELKNKETEKPISNICFHLNTSVVDMSDICNDCGQVVMIKNFISEDSKFYSNDSKQDTRRCNFVTIKESNIYKQLDLIKGIPSDIREKANDRYNKFFRKEVHRGAKLKGIIFAIVFELYKESSIKILPLDIYKYLDITRKTALFGTSNYNRLYGKTSNILPTGPEYYIEPILKLFNGNTKDIENVKLLYSKIKSKSTIINSSNPTSICSSLIYYYSKLIGKDIKIEDFAKTIGLSKITIDKLYKHIKSIFDKEKS